MIRKFFKMLWKAVNVPAPQLRARKMSRRNTPWPNGPTTAELAMIKALAEQLGPGNYEGLSAWLVKNIPWTADKGMRDEWKSIGRTLSEKAGDCEDISTIAYEVLKAWGLKDVTILCVYALKKNSGHAVTVFRASKTSEWFFYTNGILRSGYVEFKYMPNWVAKDSGYKGYRDFRVVGSDRKWLTKEEICSLG